MEEKKYNEDGYLIVAETDKCPLWEKDTIPCMAGWDRDCFFCRYSDFRTKEFIDKVENVPKTGEWCSICRNEKNRKLRQSG